MVNQKKNFREKIILIFKKLTNFVRNFEFVSYLYDKIYSFT